MHPCSAKQMKQSESGSPQALARRFVGNRVTMTVAGSARALGLPAIKARAWRVRPVPR